MAHGPTFTNQSGEPDSQRDVALRIQSEAARAAFACCSNTSFASCPKPHHPLVHLKHFSILRPSVLLNFSVFLDYLCILAPSRGRPMGNELLVIKNKWCLIPFMDAHENRSVPFTSVYFVYLVLDGRYQALRELRSLTAEHPVEALACKDRCST